MLKQVTRGREKQFSAKTEDNNNKTKGVEKSNAIQTHPTEPNPMSVLARMAYSSSRAVQGSQRPYFGRQPLPLPSAGEIIDANPSRSPWEVAPVVRPPGGNPNEIELPAVSYTHLTLPTILLV